VHKALKNSK